MKLTSSFEIPADPQAAWTLLMDVPRVLPCMPGTELVRVVGPSEWEARMRVKVGPIALVFDADIERADASDAERRVTLAAKARETRGRGHAEAAITSTVQPGADGGTLVALEMDMALSGPIAQYGRSIVEDVSERLIESFARCLSAQLTSDPDAAQAALEEQARPVAGLRLFLRALRAAFFRPIGLRGRSS